VRGQKLEKLLGDHEARFIRWHIYAPLAVKLLNSIATKVFISRKMCTISNHGLSVWIFFSRHLSRCDFSIVTTSRFYRPASSLISSLSLRLSPLSSCRLSHLSLCHLSCRVAYPIAQARCCILASLVVPLPLSLHLLFIVTLLSHRLLSCLTSHHLWCRYQCQKPPRHCQWHGQAACTCVVCVPACLLPCALTIHWGTSCPSRFCDLCLCTSGVDIM